MNRVLLEIAYKDNTVAIEDLPYPIVLYPGFYGAFFGFKKDEKSDVFFCSCCKEAIETYVEFRLRDPSLNSKPTKQFILSSSEFPLSVVENLMSRTLPANQHIIDHIYFENKLCHECNKKTPSYLYCHKMYGGVFRQRYGWYIKKKAYEIGVKLPFFENIPERCSQDVLDLISLPERKAIVDKLRSLKSSDRQSFKSFELKGELARYDRKINNLIENEVRLSFGHKKIGEAWTSETILFYIVQSMLDNVVMLRHYRSDFLNGLELDIYIPTLKLGIEYQGIQHFKPVSHWGGKEAFTMLQKRDKDKKKICEHLGIRLIYFKYNEELSDKFVAEKIGQTR